MLNIVIKNDEYYCNKCEHLCTIMTGKGTKEPVFCPKKVMVAKWVKSD